MDFPEYISEKESHARDVFAEIKETLHKDFSLENIFLFWMLMISVSATPLTRSLDPRDNPIGIAISVILTIAVCIKYGISLSRHLCAILSILIAWISIHYFYDSEFKILAYFTLLFKVYLAFVTVNVFREGLWAQFHNIVYKLTLIDLVMWVLQNIVGTNLMKSLALLPSTGTSRGSFLIYSVANNEIYEGLGIAGLLRNAGFCWEPGFYACVLVFAIFANLIIYENTWRGNKELCVLIAALITTASTTGYVAFFALILVSLFIKNKNSFNATNVTALIFSTAVLIWVMQLPFMQEKIKSQSNSQDFLTEQEYGISALETADRIMTVDRFEGMSLDILNIIDKPWLGYGTPTNAFVYRNVSEYIRISNGTTTTLAIYGIPLACVIIILLIYNSLQLRRFFPSCNSSWFITLLITSVGYNFLNFPLYLAFSLFYVLLLQETEEEVLYEEVVEEEDY